MAIAIAFALAVVAAARTAQAQTYQVIHSFTGFGGDTYEPLAGLTIDAAGNLYGTTYEAGDHGSGSGSVFRLSPKGSNWIYTLLHVFHYGTDDGANPGARVIFGPDGALYGTTVFGGTYGAGTVYKIRPPARACLTALCPWTVSLLYSFNPPYGWDANGIVFDPAGNIYGTTSQGGPGGAYDGVLYELSPSNNGRAFTLLHDFNDPQGSPHLPPPFSTNTEVSMGQPITTFTSLRPPDSCSCCTSSPTMTGVRLPAA